MALVNTRASRVLSRRLRTEQSLCWLEPTVRSRQGAIEVERSAAPHGRFAASLVPALVNSALVGLPVAWWLSRFVESQLYGVTPMDATSIAGAVLALGAAALVAGLAPTRRAVKVEPIRALRTD